MKNFGSLLAVLAILALIVIGASRYSASDDHDELRLWFLDVGQGDAILFDTPDHHQVLIDGGPDGSVLSQLSRALPLGDKEIDLVISTHNDADHLAGLNEVLGHYTVNRLWITGAIHTTKTYQTFTNLIAAKKVPTEKVMAGATVKLGLLEGVAIGPLTSFDGVTPGQQNAAGIVTFWQYGNEHVLLTADIAAEQERAMLARGVIHPAEILKIAHHGSHYSSTEPFLKAVAPKVSVISVGARNRYGHPTTEVLDRLKSLGIPVLRTDQGGAIRFSIWPDRFEYSFRP